MRRDRRHPLTLRSLVAGAIVLAALAVRVGYVEHTPFKAVNDAGTYNRLGANVAQAGDYETGDNPGSGAGGSRGPTAYFPPGYPYFLGLVDIVDGHRSGHKAAITGDRIGGAVLGALIVGLIGLVALEAFGATEALCAMALAAFYPVLIELSGTLVAENLLIVFMLGAVWAALRARQSPRPLTWDAATGLFTGLATLTHQNAILLVVPLGYAVWSSARPRPDRAQVSGSALAGPTILILMTVLAIAPWTVRNAVELHHFVPVSDETGITLVGTYNPQSAAAHPIPYKWRFFWDIPSDARLVKTAGRYDEVTIGDKLQSQAVDYIGAHPGSVVSAGWHNALRMFELEGSAAWRASAQAIGLHPGVARTGVIAFWVLCAVAIAGAFTRAARRAPGWLWLIPVLFALTVVFINVETPRFREPIDVFAVMLAGCAAASSVRGLHALVKRFGVGVGA